MPTAKKQALEMVKKLPAKATWADIMMELTCARRSKPVFKLLMKGEWCPTKT
jgi:hypothetical protein